MLHVVTILVLPLSHRLLDPCEAHWITPRSLARNLNLKIESLPPSLSHHLNDSYSSYSSLSFCPSMSLFSLLITTYLYLHLTNHYNELQKP
jgi:hypothetical protein